MVYVRRLASAVLLSLLLVSCAVTSGSTFAGIIEASPTQPEESETPSESVPILSVRTDPSDAAVWLDGDYLGTTPVDLEELAPGTYRLRIEKEGYYPERRWVEISAGTALQIEIDLDQITGSLAVAVTPTDAEVVVGGSSLADGIVELPVGSHRVSVRRFGFREESLTVEIQENRVTRVSVTLDRAPFELSGVSSSRSVFNPENPGATGFVRLGFEVSSPGDGTLAIVDPNGVEIQSIDLPTFATWEQHVRWPNQASPLPLKDGSYTLVLTLRGADGRVQSSETAVRVDSSLVVRYRAIWHSTPGLLYAMAPAPLPQRNLQATLLAAGAAAVIDGEPAARFPIKAGARLGLGSAFELGLFGSLIATSAPLLDLWGAGLSLSWQPVVFQSDSVTISAGLATGGTYRTPDAEGMYAGSDTFTDFPGFFVASPLVLSVGPVSMSATGEFRLALAPVTYSSVTLANVWTPYAYGRVGLYADFGGVTTGVSTAIRTIPLNTGFGLELPLQAGIEFHWVVPGTSFALSAFAAGEFDSFRDFYVMGGAGVGVFF